jgi:hypothetical protein
MSQRPGKHPPTTLERGRDGGLSRTRWDPNATHRRGAGSWLMDAREQKTPPERGFLTKPSDGLEPSTPSLPSKPGAVVRSPSVPDVRETLGIADITARERRVEEILATRSQPPLPERVTAHIPAHVPDLPRLGRSPTEASDVAGGPQGREVDAPDLPAGFPRQRRGQCPQITEWLGPGSRSRYLTCRGAFAGRATRHMPCDPQNSGSDESLVLEGALYATARQTEPARPSV